MVRVHHQKPVKQGQISRPLRGPKVAKQRNKHRIIVEDVDKKSQSVLFFDTEPPAGYTFIPAGNPELTAALKEFAKKGNHKVLAVTTTPHATRHKLSREVHRIGFHFPTEVVAKVCAYYGIRLTSGGKLVEEREDDKLFMKLYQKGHLVLDEKVRDQVTINTEAKQIITDLFPNIPDNDLFQIIKTAFQLGDGKVGTADEIPLVRRAQLSVVAHVRHTYTEYDKLLRQVAYSEARHRVEPLTLQKLVEWRGDDEDKQAVEDTLREVVVISDEDDSDEDIEDGQVLDHSNVRVQVISNGAKHERENGDRARSPVEIHSDDEAPRGFRYLPQIVRRIPIHDSGAMIAARQQSRYDVWDRYRSEYRSAALSQPTQIVQRVPIDSSNVPHHTTSSYITREPVYDLEPQSQMGPPVHIRGSRQQSPPTYVRGADGRLYEKIVLPTEPASQPPVLRRAHSPQPSARPLYSRTQPASPRSHGLAPHRRTISFEGNDGSVLPSIEGPQHVPPSPSARRNPFEVPEHSPYRKHSGGYQTQFHEFNAVNSANSPLAHSKRRRVGGSPPSPFLQSAPQPTANPDRSDIRPRFPDHPVNSTLESHMSSIPDFPGQPTSGGDRRMVYYEPLVSQANHVHQGAAARPAYPAQREPIPSITHAVPRSAAPVRRVYMQDEHPSYRAVEHEGYNEDGRVFRTVHEMTRDQVPVRHYADNAMRHVQLEARPSGGFSTYATRQAQPELVPSREYLTSPAVRKGPASDYDHYPTQSVSTAYHQPLLQSQPDSRYRNGPHSRTTYVQN